MGRIITKEEVQRRLDQITVDVDVVEWAASKLLNAEELAKFLDVPQSTLDEWCRDRTALTLLSNTGEPRYPRRQFEGRPPVSGNDQVRSIFCDNEATWEWLVTPNVWCDNLEPIERLRQGNVEDVVRAAEGDLDFQP